MTNGTFQRDRFTNRDAEIQIIFERVIASLRDRRPVNPQFIEYNGIWGIGKTTILRRIEDHCKKEDLHPIWIDASDNRDYMFRKVAEDIALRYKVTYADGGDDIDQLLAAISALLEKYGATVVFIDSLDDVKEERLEHIKDLVDRLLDRGKLLCVLASRSKIDFYDHSIRARLLPKRLKSFSHEHCISYVNILAPELTKEEISQICLLTRGYPAAVNVVVTTIKQEKLNSTLEQDRKRLVQSINEQVIERGILASIRHDSDELLKYQTLLSLLAIPRHFNIPIMQKLIGKFAQNYEKSTSYAYIPLFGSLSRNTNLFDWQAARSGYSMEAPVRQFFLVKSKIEQPERGALIHEFLMEQNWYLAMGVSGTDRVRYIQEYLYHSASCLDHQKLQDNIDRAVKQVLEETPGLILQFEEEYRKDQELQEVLNIHKDSVFAKIYRFFAEMSLELALTEQDKQQRITLLQSYASYSMKDPTLVDPLSSILQCVQHIKEVLPDDFSELVQQLSQDQDIINLIEDDPQGRKLE